MKWVETVLDELVEEEIGSDTKVEKNDFKVTIEQFAECCQIVVNDINNAV